MSLVAEYSSDEDNGHASSTNDVFGLSSFPATKKARVDESSASLTIEAAPHVLAEVCVEHTNELAKKTQIFDI